MILANILHRKTRTLLCIAGVSLGVVLVVVTAGLVNGFLSKQAERNSAVSAELMIRPAGRDFGLGFELTAAPSLPVSMIESLKSVEGVSDAVAVAQYLQANHLIDGIDYESFTRVSDARVVEGRPAVEGDEVMVDAVLQRNWKLKPGDEIELFDTRFKVVGIYAPESLARFKVPLSTMQRYLNRPGLCSMVLVKAADTSRQEEIAARIRERFSELGVIETRDLPRLFARGTPALQTFLRVVVGLAATVSILVILLAMYTTITERTRQIGILKSLGASKLWIATEIEKEALLITLAGALAGFIVSVTVGFVIENLTSLKVDFNIGWFVYSLLISIASGAMGALYPALRAANQDPVKALGYE